MGRGSDNLSPPPDTASRDRQQLAGEPHALIDDLARGLRHTAEQVVPWFLERMPAAYFHDTDHDTRLRHLHAVLAARASGMPLRLTLRSDDGSTWTYISDASYPGLLAELLQQLPRDRPLRTAKIYTAIGGELVVDLFEFGTALLAAYTRDPQTVEDPPGSSETLAVARERMQLDDEALADLTRHLERCPIEYVSTMTTGRILANWRLCRRVSGTDDTVVTLESEVDPQVSRISIASGNGRPRTMFERAARLLSSHGVDIRQAYLDLVPDHHARPGELGRSGRPDDSDAISLLGFIVDCPDAATLDPQSERWAAIRTALMRLEWLDDHVLTLAETHPQLGLVRAEVLVALERLVHPAVAEQDAYAFALSRIERLAERHLELSTAIVDLLIERFDPGVRLADDTFERRQREIEERIDGEVDGDDARRLLRVLSAAAGATLRTNLFLEGRYGLALRFDPELFASPSRPEMPYGAFFVQGRGFDGFHVRFRDVARGGVRVIRPQGLEQHALAAEGLYDEAYRLAHAQQLKNKDIPEGGSKGVIVVAPGHRVDRCVKAFADGLLDLITPAAQVRERVIDRLGLPELLYLGPDENISPAMITWMVDRAARRGHPLPEAFMSSKPGAGISHRDYGVTSEGVTVFLEEALHAVGIDPRAQPFTVKLTGGPDGDVAGNEIKILAREYGDNARIVGIADGSGTAEDPGGLAPDELLRLVERSQPIAAFDRARLGPRGRVVSIDEPRGVQLRNTMHDRVVADAFVPAGGRPSTIHEGNWRDHLVGPGRASSRVIVEGANLFITPEARRALTQHAGLLIVKDSSANKCGVICSSFEVVAGMLLDPTELLAVKERFVSEVLVKLRRLARSEARLLFREHRRRPSEPLPDLSVRLSRVILEATGAIEAALDTLDEQAAPLMRRLALDHLPPVLVELAGDRLDSRVPQGYLHGIMSTALATRIVYREGLDYLDALGPDRLAELAIRYLNQEQEIAALAAEVAGSELPHRERIVELLRRGGTRAGLALLLDGHQRDGRNDPSDG